MIDNQRNIIGGIFGLHMPETGVLNELNKKFNLKSNVQFFCNARSGIHAVFSALNPNKIWYPSYLCPSMLKIPSLLNSKLDFYPIDQELNIVDKYWIENIQQGDVVVMIAYFGYPIDEHIACAIKSKGAYVLEDASQALLSDHVGANSDYIVYSPRKFFGLPDGGILTYSDGLPKTKSPDNNPPYSWWIKAFRAYLLRHQWDVGSKEVKQEDWFLARKLAGKETPCGYYRMSTLSEAILTTEVVDWGEIRAKRRGNYELLLSAIANKAIYKSLPSDVVPLGFPIRISAAYRDDLLKALYKEKIYPPVHWNISGHVPEIFSDSHQLYAEEITLPCDQRYDLNDMYKIIETIKAFGV
jgi:dTDP-4-amino-4,6-dideoxygalactose transaminase